MQAFVAVGAFMMSWSPDLTACWSGLRMLQAMLDATPQESVMVGDNANDLAVARAVSVSAEFTDSLTGKAYTCQGTVPVIALSAGSEPKR